MEKESIFDEASSYVRQFRLELNILGMLIDSDDVEEEFRRIFNKYPECLRGIPLLLGVKEHSIYYMDDDGGMLYDFQIPNQPVEHYIYFMRKTGLFDMMEKRTVRSFCDYVMGLETAAIKQKRQEERKREISGNKDDTGE